MLRIFHLFDSKEAYFNKKQVRNAFWRFGLVFYRFSFRSPSLIQPRRRISLESPRQISAGRRKQISIRPNHCEIPGVCPPSLVQPRINPTGPSIPQVPMPEKIAVPCISSLKKQVARGPVMAEAMMGGNQTSGLRTMLGIWSMEVPSPWERSPAKRFSLKDMTAKPTI